MYWELLVFVSPLEKASCKMGCSTRTGIQTIKGVVAMVEAGAGAGGAGVAATSTAAESSPAV